MSVPSPSSTRVNARNAFLLTFAALMLVQLAWILAVPAFLGNDEVDHDFKAEAVAHGQFLDTGAAAHGRGGLVRVPGDVVDAASAVCERHKYTGPDNCRAVERFDDGSVTVATAASRYQPAYYVIAGLTARPFHGFGSLYALRVTTAVISALLLAWAVLVTRRWAATAWPFVALGVAVTPVFLNSTSTGAPNGVGFAAACLLWSAAMGLVERPGFAAWAALTTGASVMLVTHTSNGVWLASIALVLALRLPHHAWRELLRLQVRGARLSMAAVASVVMLAGAWILIARTNALDPEVPGAHGVSAARLAVLQFVWAFQTIGAFPSRAEMAPTPVYALWLVPFALLMVAALRYGARRQRVMLGVLLVLWVAIPMTLTVISYRHLGAAWQGRYGLPLAVGFPIVAGAVLDRYGPVLRRPLVMVTVAVLGLAHVWSIFAVARDQIHKGFPSTPAALLLGGPWTVGLLALAGVLILVRAIATSRALNPLPTNVVLETAS